MAFADLGVVFAAPTFDAGGFGRLVGKVGVTTGRLVTAGVSTMPRLLEVDTNEGVDRPVAGNALGIELTRGIASVGPVVWFNPAEDVATGATATGDVVTGDEATDVAAGTGLLASKELGSAGTATIVEGLAGAAVDDARFAGTAVAVVASDVAEFVGVERVNDGAIVGVTTAVCGGRGIGAETRGYSGTLGAFNTMDVASGVAVGTGSLAANLISGDLVSAFLSSVDELSAAVFAPLGFEVLGVTGSAARATAAAGPGATFEIVSPPIRIACGIENSSTWAFAAIDVSADAWADLSCLRLTTSVALAAGDLAI